MIEFYKLYFVLVFFVFLISDLYKFKVTYEKVVYIAYIYK